MTTLFLEAALRSLLMAATVWAGIRLLRVSNVIAQKIAWSLVLLASFAMPLLVRSFPAKPVVRVPAHYFTAPVVRVTHAVSRRPEEPAAATLSLQLLQPLASSAHWQMPRPAALVIPAYLCVSAILLLRVLTGLIIAARIWSRARRASPILEPRASVRISSDLGSPVTIGSGIVLPDSYPEWDATKLRIVLAHERSHVRQADFYLQLLAGLYTAIFWFSPLGWWLQRQLADLGEAISDRAAVDEAANRSSYAEVLLEFAAMPRRAVAGVGMARSSNIQRRIDRLLTDHQFRLAFVAVRRHALLALAIVPLALLAATSLVGVQAAQAAAAKAVRIAPLPRVLAKPLASIAAIPAQDAAPPTPPAPAPDPVLAPSPADAPDPSSAPLTAPPAPPALPAMRGALQAPAAPPLPPASSDRSHYSYSYSDSEDSRDAYAIVDGESVNMVGSFDTNKSFDKARSRFHGKYIWVWRDGKSYVIEDPAIVAKGHALFAPIEELGRKQAELGEQQAKLGERQALLGEKEAKVTVSVPDLSKELARIDAELKNLRELNGKEMQLEDLAELQSKLGDLQGRLGELQGLAGSKQGEFGEQQGKLGEEQGELGEKQGKLGEEQGRLGKEANEKMKSLIDAAVRDGKAKPID